ncbi:hypothetical protein TanjilG_12824 [Lupinus angustifolius]|uniref:WAT1-related protein n=1 Tax=Lupinus angustifolius TaxID=3871 RepID=A0A1J7GPY7_LUPAN|nr:hypothetical protein TanjilG_12824 [Lupinus angustifolius]
MGGVKEWFRSSQAVLSMLLVQLFATGMQLLSRVILVQGTFIFALIAYRHIVAALCVAPFALYFERGHAKKFTWSVCSWIFINALVGMTMALGLFYYGLRDTSATYSVNFLNLVPICTFLVSIICGMEKLGLQTWSGKAKAVGAILCVGGAIATSLYKGKDIYIFHGYHTHTNVVAHKTYMLGGTFFLVGSCLSYTAWFIIQGALATAATFCLLSWAITIKGSTYPPMFNPLALIFVALSEALILGEPLKVGMFLGMVLIIIGLYSFLWGKNKETQCLPQPNVAAGEVASMATEPVGMQSIAIVPSSSPKDSVILEIQKT